MDLLCYLCISHSFLLHMGEFVPGILAWMQYWILNMVVSGRQWRQLTVHWSPRSRDNIESLPELIKRINYYWELLDFKLDWVTGWDFELFPFKILAPLSLRPSFYQWGNQDTQRTNVTRLKSRASVGNRAQIPGRLVQYPCHDAVYPLILTLPPEKSRVYMCYWH